MNVCSTIYPRIIKTYWCFSAWLCLIAKKLAETLSRRDTDLCLSSIFFHGCAQWIIASIKLAQPKYCDYINFYSYTQAFCLKCNFRSWITQAVLFLLLRAVFAAVSAICAINLFFHAIIVRIVRIIVRTASISEIEFLQNSSQSQSLTSTPSTITSFSLCL